VRRMPPVIKLPARKRGALAGSFHAISSLGALLVRNPQSPKNSCIYSMSICEKPVSGMNGCNRMKTIAGLLFPKTKSSIDYRLVFNAPKTWFRGS
jgi:hypothetical protein